MIRSEVVLVLFHSTVADALLVSEVAYDSAQAFSTYTPL